MTRWSLRYDDGSANSYRFRSDGDSAVFDYVPVTPEQSSTGTYSGGPPRTGRLDRAGVESLRTHVRALESDPALRGKERAKGTGVFQIDDEHGTRKFIIVRGPALLAFDAFVRAL